MAVAVGITSSGSAANLTSVTVSHTIAAGTNRLLLVAVGWTGTSTTMAVTYGGVTLTPVGTALAVLTAFRVQHFYLPAPTVGTADIVATASAASYIQIGGVNVTGAAQTAPEAVSNSDPTTTLTPTGTVTTLTANAFVFGLVGINNATTTLSTSSSQTVFMDLADATVNRRSTAAYRGPEGAAGSKTMSWLESGATARTWGQQLVSVADASAPPPTVPSSTGNFLAFF